MAAVQLWKKLTEATAKLHLAEAKEARRGQLSNKIKELKKELDHANDSAARKLREKLEQREAELHEVKRQNEKLANAEEGLEEARSGSPPPEPRLPAHYAHAYAIRLAPQLDATDGYSFKPALVCCDMWM